MMSTLKKDVMTLDFQRVAKRFAMLVVVLVVVCAGATAFLLRTQIGELFALAGQPGMLYGDGLEHALEASLAGFSGGGMTAASAGARTALLVSALVVLALGAAYWLIVAGWLCQTAVRAGKSGVFWLVLALIGNLAAVALFFILRSWREVRCEACGGWSGSREAYCRHCGAALAHNCPTCGAAVKRGDTYCTHCGQALEHDEH